MQFTWKVLWKSYQETTNQIHREEVQIFPNIYKMDTSNKCRDETREVTVPRVRNDEIRCASNAVATLSPELELITPAWFEKVCSQDDSCEEMSSDEDMEEFDPSTSDSEEEKDEVTADGIVELYMELMLETEGLLYIDRPRSFTDCLSFVGELSLNRQSTQYRWTSQILTLKYGEILPDTITNGLILELMSRVDTDITHTRFGPMPFFHFRSKALDKYFSELPVHARPGRTLELCAFIQKNIEKYYRTLECGNSMEKFDRIFNMVYARLMSLDSATRFLVLLFLYGSDFSKIISRTQPKRGVQGGVKKVVKEKKKPQQKKPAPKSRPCTRSGCVGMFDPVAKKCDLCPDKKPRAQTGKQPTKSSGKKNSLVQTAVAADLEKQAGIEDASKDAEKDELCDAENKAAGIQETISQEVHNALGKLKTEILSSLTPVPPPPSGGTPAPLPPTDFAEADPTKLGIAFRTGTSMYIEAERTLVGRSRLGKFFDTTKNYLRKNAPTLERLVNFSGYVAESVIDAVPTGIPRLVKDLALIYIDVKSNKYEEQKTLVRRGGVLHTISVASSVSETTDSRVDYLAIGDVKHSDPLYCRYSKVALDVKVPSWKQHLYFYMGRFASLGYDETERRFTMGDSQISKEVFYNNANYRIGPHVSDECARNAIDMSLAKCVTVNLSKRFIERSTSASECSDEAVSRTREALLNFRTHLKEEAVLRHYSQLIAEAGVNPGVGKFTPYPGTGPVN